jgi:transcriptional regulator with XRE-family HTH domain
MKKLMLVKLGKRVKEYRIGKKLSQEELAAKANVHRTYIGMIERGEKNITITNLKKISDALEVDLSILTKNL